MIVTATPYAYRGEDGVYVVPLGCLKPDEVIQESESQSLQKGGTKKRHATRFLTQMRFFTSITPMTHFMISIA